MTDEHPPPDDIDTQARELLGQLDDRDVDLPATDGSYRPTAIALIVCDHTSDLEAYRRMLAGVPNEPTHVMSLVWALAEVAAAGFQDATVAGVPQHQLTWVAHRHATAQPISRAMGAVAFDLVHALAAGQRPRAVQLLADVLVVVRTRQASGYTTDTEALVQALTATAHQLVEIAGRAMQLDFDEVVQAYGRVAATP